MSTVSNHWKGLSNIQNSSDAAVQSDQLTIQFIAPTNMTNCEGVNVLAGDLIVERYFYVWIAMVVPSKTMHLHVMQILLCCSHSSTDHCCWVRRRWSNCAAY